MFVYEKDNKINIVNGKQLPQTYPDIAVGFTADGEPTVEVGGFAVQLGGTGGTVMMSDTISLNGVEMTVPNPELTARIEDGEYYVEGTMSAAPSSVLKAWGYADDVTHLFIVKIIFEGDIDPDTFSGTIVGTETKSITYDIFDGPNYIYYILNGNITEFTITYKANEDAEEKTIIIHNDATLEEVA